MLSAESSCYTGSYGVLTSDYDMISGRVDVEVVVCEEGTCSSCGMETMVRDGLALAYTSVH